MIQKEKCLVIDIDGTLCREKEKSEKYLDVEPNWMVVNKMIEYKKNGFYLILYTSRNMNTFDGNLGLINAITSKETLEWLTMHKIPFDEIHYGKPWCGKGGFYIDDKAIRPNEFLNNPYETIIDLINGK